MVRTTSTNSALPFPPAVVVKGRPGDLQADVGLKDFCHQPVDAAAKPRGDELKDVGTAELRSSALDCLDGHDAADSGKQPFLAG